MPVILIVDDTLTVLDLLEHLLETEYTVFKASSGEEGWDLFSRESVDLVITDIDMPGISGLELLERVREGHPLLPVVAISGDFDPQAALAAGFNAFIAKPFKIDAVLQVAAELVEKKRKVLIVEDAIELRKTMVTVVERLGLQGIEAGDGAQALEILKREGADLVISDCSMPVLSGREFLPQVKAGYPGLPIVVVSATYNEEDLETLKPFGFLRKPYRLDDLRKLILEAVPTDRET